MQKSSYPAPVFSAQVTARMIARAFKEWQEIPASKPELRVKIKELVEELNQLTQIIL